ncbi:MAG: aminotransferase class V-fold PLP-dependent enzyme [Acidobacteria bacterium]|nr:MAG: aminotransferase class V-fold PLP-dependent enzyme [Acidobacteriota bacterium]
MDELLEWRKEFPILENTVYMISHSLGAMPRRVYDRLREYADIWASRGIRAWEEGWWEMPVTTGNLLARIIGARPGEVVMHQNVSVGVALVLSCFDFTGRRNKIVYTDMEFPSVMYVCEAFSGYGARSEVVASEDGLSVPMDKILAAIDEETQVVVISHVFFKSAAIVDPKPIVERAHEVGAKVLLDAYQSVGTVPVDVKELDVDFLVGGSVKWLCGGPGAGYLYVRPDLWSQLEPKVTGWMAHARPFAFEVGPIEYAPDIRRFLHGSPHIPAFYAAQSGYEIIAEIGVDKIRRKSMRQTSRLIELAEERGYRVNAPRDPHARGGTVAIDVPHARAVAAELNRRDVLVDYRPGAGIRLAPHFYTKDEELELAIREIGAILETKAYERHLATGGS